MPPRRRKPKAKKKKPAYAKAGSAGRITVRGQKIKLVAGRPRLDITRKEGARVRVRKIPAKAKKITI